MSTTTTAGARAETFVNVPTPHRSRRPRRPVERTTDDLAMLLASAASGLALSWLIFARFTDGIGWFGFLLVAFAAFVGLYYLVMREQHGSLVAADRVASVVVVTGGFVLLVPMVWLIGYVIAKGLPGLRPGFFFHDQRGVTPSQAATAGGGAHAVIGTIEQVGLALLWSLPLGVLCAVFLNESRSKWRRPVRIFVDAMSGIPSIVAGLFIFAVLILPYAKTSTFFSFSGLMASLALAMIMLPTITQTITLVLRLVPDGLREASLALGASRVRTVFAVVLPTARTGMTTAVVLGIARAVGETAPLIFTSFGFALMNANPMKGAQESLPLFVYRFVQSPNVSFIDRAFTGALVLMTMVLGLFGLARYIGRDRSKAAAGQPKFRVQLPSRLSLSLSRGGNS